MCRRTACPWNYLRVRGEYLYGASRREKKRELPPRARRIRDYRAGDQQGLGTTSACAENTVGLHAIIAHGGNYLRVRGEYYPTRYRTSRPTELPPRARRILVGVLAPTMVNGTTSACAENTADTHRQNVSAGNYLRVRGEYSPACLAPLLVSELPPRARRIQRKNHRCDRAPGTTSACAENTATLYLPSIPIGNYLRVRGEYSIADADLLEQLELPPRARRIPTPTPCTCSVRGTTSACAENTHPPAHSRYRAGNYLRVRGEYGPPLNHHMVNV